MLISGSQTANDAGASNGRVDDGNNALQLCLEHGIEILTSPNSNQSVRVCEL